MTLQVMTPCSLMEYKLFVGTYCLRVLCISSNSDEQLSQTCSLTFENCKYSYLNELDVHGNVYHDTNIREMTNKMQLCRTIYYSIVP
jgi:hypothetical protein